MWFPTWRHWSRGCQEGQRGLGSPMPRLFSVPVKNVSRGQQSALGVTAHPEVLLLFLGYWHWCSHPKGSP